MNLSSPREENLSYEELKTELRDKYYKKFLKVMSVLKFEISEMTDLKLGSQFNLLVDQISNLKSQKEKIKNDVISSNEYKELQQQLIDLKNQVTSCLISDKELAQKNLSKTMDKIATQNVRINNLQKEVNKSISEKSKELIKILENHKKEVEDIRSYVLSKIRDEFSILIGEFNNELDGYKLAFNVEDDSVEYPFNENKLDFDVPILKTNVSNLMNDVTQDDEQKRKFYFCENTSDIKN